MVTFACKIMWLIQSNLANGEGWCLIWPTAVPHFSAFMTQQQRGEVDKEEEKEVLSKNASVCLCMYVIYTHIYPFICWQAVGQEGIQGHQLTRAERQADQTHCLTHLWFLRDVLLTNTSLITQASLTGVYVWIYECECVHEGREVIHITTREYKESVSDI